MAKSPSHQLGRPTKYKKEFCKRLEEHMAQGFSFRSFGAIINVTEETLHQWKKKHPAFSESYKKATLGSLLYHEKLLKIGMLGAKTKNIDGKKINTALLIFTLKARFNYREYEQPEDTEYQWEEENAFENRKEEHSQ